MSEYTSPAEYTSRLRHNILQMPPEIQSATGIVINGRRLKSLVFTTDIAIIKNCDADGVFAVYPFTPQQSISDALIKHSSMPVFCGVGGGTTRGTRTRTLAKDVESQGAIGVVLNAPISNEDLKMVSDSIDIPVVITVVNKQTDILARLENGASILNIAAALDTPEVVRYARSVAPNVPIIATGGKTGEHVMATIEAGANAITYTPPSTQELFQKMMQNYRNQ
jgi:2-keto-3-deoxy-6-phosphogluconate aldolase